jgi:hypothetical protein
MAGLARAVLDRYPALRETWPARRALAWREQQRRRAQPRRMAAWFRETDDMQTRLFVSNLELPEAAGVCQPASVRVALLDQAGLSMVDKRFTIARNASLVLELGDLLPAERRGRVPSGQVSVDFEGEHLGSSRAYLHWYNQANLTSSHEKFGLTIPAVGGYWSVPNVQDSEEYQVYLAVGNLESQVYVSELTLKDDEGHALSASLELPPHGSRFVGLDSVFRDVRGFLHQRPGVLYFGNNRQAAMYYYFIRNQRLGSWRVQHL